VSNVAGKQISVIHDAASAGLWIGSAEGLTQLDPESMRAQHYQHDEKIRRVWQITRFLLWHMILKPIYG